MVRMTLKIYVFWGAEGTDTLGNIWILSAEGAETHAQICMLGAEGAETPKHMCVLGAEGAETLENLYILGAEGAETRENIFLPPAPFEVASRLLISRASAPCPHASSQIFNSRMLPAPAVATEYFWKHCPLPRGQPDNLGGNLFVSQGVYVGRKDEICKNTTQKTTWTVVETSWPQINNR